MSLFLFFVSLFFFYISLSIAPLSLWLLLSVPVPTSSAHLLSFISLQCHSATSLALLFRSSLLHYLLLCELFRSPPLESLSPSLPSVSPSVRNVFLCATLSFRAIFLPLSLTLPLPFFFIHTSIPVSSSLPLWTLHLIYPASHPFPSVPVPRYPYLCIYTCLFPFIFLLHLLASHIITSPFSSSWCLFLPLFPVFPLPCDGIKSPHLSLSISFSRFWWIFSHFLVIISLICLFLSLPISLSRGEWR